MSLLLDKLRGASRPRNVKPAAGKPLENGLLARALQRAEAERAALRRASEHGPMPLPEPQAEAEIALTLPEPPRSNRGVIVALLVMALAVAAAALWNYPSEQPKHVPVFKLDHELDLNRTDASGRSSPPDPGPSR